MPGRPNGITNSDSIYLIIICQCIVFTNHCESSLCCDTNDCQFRVSIPNLHNGMLKSFQHRNDFIDQWNLCLGKLVRDGIENLKDL